MTIVWDVTEVVSMSPELENVINTIALGGTSFSPLAGDVSTTLNATLKSSEAPPHDIRTNDNCKDTMRKKVVLLIVSLFNFALLHPYKKRSHDQLILIKQSYEKSIIPFLIHKSK
jgi:hypothetical protein